MEIMSTLSPFENILNFVLLLLVSYPVLGAFSWLIGVICYKVLYRYQRKEFEPIETKDEPFVTIMIPAHNEEVLIEQTITYLMNDLHYHNYEVLVTDDGSTDTTPEILQRLQTLYPNLRVITIEKNQGKAHAFNIGVGFARGEFILSNDADSIPEPDALWKYMNYFMGETQMNIAAVTANMDVQNRSTLLAKSQTVEFASIVGVIKRSQVSALGNMYAYSGANTMYRRDALISVGLFRQDRATEDISIAWDHQLNGWTTSFAPDIVFFMDVPEKLKPLYHQRKRWAKGGTEVLLTNFTKILGHPIKQLKKIPFILDQTLSILWSLFFFISTILFILAFVGFLFTGNYERIYHMFCMAFIFVSFEMVAGVMQLLAAVIVDNRAHKLRYLFFMPIYMMVYWQVNSVALVMTLIPAIKTIMGYGSGTWKSPVRNQH
ncbi:glycosyltransferase family 2 protein [Latilactobacillus fuchuensis]|uniref:Family 2 glycosyltransferase n=1 Tax=Latilactobacillus fuchuensis TaxID=164393 RepID=A0A2N9DXT2_9LACO|nr:glycosyltransferase family 2 protein [Latilactobacillus fuchuensis]SPC39634.1 Family 2 glycosyltransferase [Latilactobacillus fuchuensis]